MIPIHNYHHAINKKMLWDTSDSLEVYQKHINNPATCQKLIDLGYFDVDIEYQFNSHGFRTYEIGTRVDVLCFGCSFTMGTGVHSHETWPAQLEALTGLTCVNLGHSGSSNDTAFRMAACYLKLMKPTYAVWVQTDSHRIELLDEDSNISLNIMASDTSNPCATDYFIKHWFTSVTNQQILCQKNTLAFKMLCRLENVIPIIIPRDEIPFIDIARDLMHPGRLSYQELAQTISSRMSKFNQE